MHRTRNGIALGVLLAFFGLILTSTAVEARGGPGGNSEAAKRCQQEWQTLHTSDGDSFKNIGRCVSYAAKGGEFAPLDPDAEKRGFCEGLGGTLQFEERGGVTVWLCVGVVGSPPPEEEVDYSLFCTGEITTETKGGLLVLICTPGT